jgi:hypothetical protein
VQARIGSLFLYDDDFMVLHLHANHRECPRFVAIPLRDVEFPWDITTLNLPAVIDMRVYSNMTIAWLARREE